MLRPYRAALPAAREANARATARNEAAEELRAAVREALLPLGGVHVREREWHGAGAIDAGRYDEGSVTVEPISASDRPATVKVRLPRERLVALLEAVVGVLAPDAAAQAAGSGRAGLALVPDVEDRAGEVRR